MDRATATAIRKVNERIDTLDREVRGELAVLRDEMGGGFDSLRGEIADSRRHSQLLFESVQESIRVIADGLAHVAAKIDRL